MKDNESRLLYGQYLKILEEQTAAQGNGYQLLASQGIYPNKKYNFYNLVKKWYEDNTNIPPDQIEATLKAKEQAALRDKNPNFMPLSKFKTNVKLAGPEEWDPAETTAWGYLDPSTNIMYINPYVTWSNYGNLITTVIHEALHGIQKKHTTNIRFKGGVPSKTTGQSFKKETKAANWSSRDLYNPERITHVQSGDPNVKDEYMRYKTQTIEMDPPLAQINRIIAIAKNKMIQPNALDAEKELRWVLDPKNDQYIPEDFYGEVVDLRDILSGKYKSKPNSPQEQDRIIKSWAQRLSLLAKDTKQNTNLGIA